jgi:HPt (histidine-containing phosphotransfer) domain-containing protein
MKKDWKNYEVSVHALKSTSKTIGLTGLSEEAKNLEYAARDGKVEQIEAEHDELITHYEGIVKTISEL